MAKSLICDLFRAQVWEKIGIEDALEIRGKYDMRCHKCHGRVQPHRKAVNGMKAHFEHRRAHKGCILSTGYDGTNSLHPDALE
jgi:hypothetical protein